MTYFYKLFNSFLTCEHKLGGIRHREDHQPSHIWGQAHQCDPGVLQAALHHLQPQQAAQVGQVLSCRAPANESWFPAQRGAQLVQHVQLSAAEVNGHHQEEAKRVEPQLASVERPASLSAHTSCGVQLPDSFMVARREKPCAGVRMDGLSDEQVGVESWGQIGGQDQPEWINVTAINNIKRLWRGYIYIFFLLKCTKQMFLTLVPAATGLLWCWPTFQKHPDKLLEPPPWRCGTYYRWRLPRMRSSQRGWR